jgi:hypothetical protein
LIDSNISAFGTGTPTINTTIYITSGHSYFNNNAYARFNQLSLGYTYGAVSTMPCQTQLTNPNVGTITWPQSSVYCWSNDVVINSNSVITFNGQNVANSTFIFYISGNHSLQVSAGVTFKSINGQIPANIYFVVSGNIKINPGASVFGNFISLNNLTVTNASNSDGFFGSVAGSVAIINSNVSQVTVCNSGLGTGSTNQCSYPTVGYYQAHAALAAISFARNITSINATQSAISLGGVFTSTGLYQTSRVTTALNGSTAISAYWTTYATSGAETNQILVTVKTFYDPVKHTLNALQYSNQTVVNATKGYSASGAVNGSSYQQPYSTTVEINCVGSVIDYISYYDPNALTANITDVTCATCGCVVSGAGDSVSSRASSSLFLFCITALVSLFISRFQ